MMNRREFAVAALATTAGLALAACARETEQPPTIREIIDSNASSHPRVRSRTRGSSPRRDRALHRLRAAQLGLRGAARGRDRPPAAARDRDELTRILQLHVVEGSYPASALVNRTTTLKTLSGLNIIVDGFNGIHVGGVKWCSPT